MRGLLVLALVMFASLPSHAQLLSMMNDGRFVYLPDETPVENLPTWLRELPAPEGLVGARRDFQIIPPRTGLDLAITISFDEPEAADQLLAYFRGARQGRTINTNLFQGTGLPNQRTIILRSRQLESPGVLSLSALGPELLIWRMEFQWMQARAVLVPLGSALEAPAAVLADGQVIHYDELASGEDRPPSEEWVENIIRFPLLQEPERIEGGVEYVFTLDTLPRAAMLQLDVTGLPPGAQTRVMVNGQVGGWLQVTLPSLAHGGYRIARDLAGDTQLAGWRKAQAWIPSSLLITGENSVWLEFFELSKDAPTEVAEPGSGLRPALMFGIAARHMLLEMDFSEPEALLTPAEVSSETASTVDVVSQTPSDQLTLAEDTAGEEVENDALPDEQSEAGPVTLKGEISYDLMGDMAPALMLFMEEGTGGNATAAAPASDASATGP